MATNRAAAVAAALIIAAAGIPAAPAFGAENETKSGSAATPAKLITVDYVNAEIRDVIRGLAAQSGVNLALNPEVKGQITVHLREKTVDEAIVIAANSAGLSARKVKDTFVVAPRAEMRATLEKLGMSRRVTLAHLDPKATADLVQNSFPDLTAKAQDKTLTLTGADEDLKDAAKLIEGKDVFVPEAAHAVESVPVRNVEPKKAAAELAKMVPGINASAAGENVVLSGIRSKVDEAIKGLALLDVKGQPDLDTRVYNIKYAKASQLISLVERAVPEVKVIPGPESNAPQRPKLNLLTGQFLGAFADGTSGGGSANDGSGLSGMMGGPGGPGGQAAAQSGPVGGNALTLVLQGAPADLDRAVKTLAMSDVAPRQMSIEVKVVETNPSVAEEYGLKWSWTRFGAYEAPAGTQVNTGSTGGPGGDFTSFSTRNPAFGAFSRVPWSFQAVLSAMVTKRQAKLLASPQISVLNDQDASIFIGDTLRFQSLATASPVTGSQFTVVEVPVGIILLCHPRINDDNNITLRLKPVVSTVTGLVNGLPQTSAREAETVVRVKDGDTLVLGGLIRDEDIREMSKIPVLGDLPLVGHLFRHNNRSHRRTEVMVVITVHLHKQ